MMHDVPLLFISWRALFHALGAHSLCCSTLLQWIGMNLLLYSYGPVRAVRGGGGGWGVCCACGKPLANR